MKYVGFHERRCCLSDVFVGGIEQARRACPRLASTRRYLRVLLVVVLGLSTGNGVSAQGPMWTYIASMHTTRGNPGAATGPDGRIYAIGGWDTHDNLFSSVEAYNPSTNTWTSVAPMHTTRAAPAVTGPDGRIYVIGGEGPGDTFLSSVEAYNPSTNTWTNVAPIHTALNGLAVVVGPDGRIYAIGGWDGTNAFANVEAYDPSTNTWANVAPMKTARAGLAAAVGPDGRIYAIGGVTGSVGSGLTALSSVEAYNPATNTWTNVAPMKTTRYDLAATTGPDGHIYAIGGGQFIPILTGVLSSVEAYDPATDTWTKVAPMNTVRAAVRAATGTDGRLYAIGGTDDNYNDVFSSVETYTPVVNAFLSGMITLQDCTNPVQPVRFEFRPLDGSGVFTRTVTLKADGTYSLPNIPKKNYHLAIKGAKWLQVVVTVNASNGDVSGVNATLLAGDADNNNTVDFDDLTILAIAYNTAVGDPLYDDRADFNCDGQVEFADLTLLAINYNLSGDP